MVEKVLCAGYSNSVALLVDENIIKVANRKGIPFEYVSEELKQMFLSNGYRAVPNGIPLVRLVFAFDGASLDKLEAEIIRRGAHIRAAAEKRERMQSMWNQLPEPLRPLIIGVDSVDFYPTGFSVYINLNTSYTFEQQRLLLRRGKYDMAQWLRNILPEQRIGRQAAALLPFVYISSWSLARNNQAVYRYELNPQLMDVMLKTASN